MIWAITHMVERPNSMTGGVEKDPALPAERGRAGEVKSLMGGRGR